MVIDTIDAIARMNVSGLLDLRYMEMSFLIYVVRYLTGGISDLIP
jgi:hypothetical protein